MDLNVDDQHGRPPVCSPHCPLSRPDCPASDAATLDGLFSPSFGFCRATHSAYRTRQQHAVMRKANDLDHPIRAYAIDDDVSGTANPLFLGNQTASNAEWVNPDARGSRDLLGAWAIGNGSQGGENGPHQQIVAFCRVDAESSCTLE
jgi:hypothetical protein